MLEVAALLLVTLLLPEGPLRLAWAVGVLLFAMPGIYAMASTAPFVPSSTATVQRMMRLAGIKKGEKVYDLGCGDGRLVIAAAKAGAISVGYELSLPTFLIALFRTTFVRGASVHCRDFWSADLRDANVIFCYLLGAPMQTFKKKIWPTLKPGTRVVSHSFRMDGVEPVTVEKDAVLYVKK